MELCVSLPRVTEAMFAATDITDPLLDPHGVPDAKYGFYNIIKNRMKTIATRFQESCLIIPPNLSDYLVYIVKIKTVDPIKHRRFFVYTHNVLLIYCKFAHSYTHTNV